MKKCYLILVIKRFKFCALDLFGVNHMYNDVKCVRLCMVSAARVYVIILADWKDFGQKLSQTIERLTKYSGKLSADCGTKGHLLQTLLKTNNVA